jgi:hypothetical protein
MIVNLQRSTRRYVLSMAQRQYQVDISYAKCAEGMSMTDGIRDAIQGPMKFRYLKHPKRINHLLTTENG